jgi:hypothetical protein
VDDRSTTEHGFASADENDAGVSLLSDPNQSPGEKKSTPPPLPGKRRRDEARAEKQTRDANAAAPAGASRFPEIDTGCVRLGAGHRGQRFFTPWVTSLLLHAAVLLTAAGLLAPLMMVGQPQVVVVGFKESDSGSDLEEMPSLSELDDLSDMEAVAMAMAVAPIEVDALTDLLPPSESATLAVSVDRSDSLVMPAAYMLDEVRQMNVARPASGQLREAGSVEAAVDGIVGDIRERLEHDDLLVAWLFDSSISLLDDRRRVAERLHAMFDEIADGSSSHKFMNAALAFGGGTRSLVGPTDDVTRIVKAVRDVPIDRSGTENVLSAVESAVNRFTRRWRHEVMVVVWTDESGDDLDRLEPVIHLCRQHGVSVSVVGPSAMLGRQTGTHVFRDPASGQIFSLPIKRGPDTALSQRFRLPYWYGTNLPGWAMAAGFGGTGLPPWYGGPQLEKLSSGFGPYALTRLALATGGTFTVFDRPANRGPFRLETMRPYQPDYRRESQIAADVTNHPLRQAVLDVVALSHETNALDPPETVFFVRRPHGPDGPPITLYYPATRFRSMLRSEMTRRKTQANKTGVVLEGLLARFGPADMDEELYEQEESPRWRAWHDLTRGRLLAMSVRQAEYALLAELLSRRGPIARQTNHIMLVPSASLRGSDDVRARAAEAERLLNRCMKENLHTPWAYLAQRELDHPLGIDVRQTSLPPPVPVQGGGMVVPAGPAPQVNLPQL